MPPAAVVLMQTERSLSRKSSGAGSPRRSASAVDAEDGGDRPVAARDLAGEGDERRAVAVGQRRVDAVGRRVDRDALAQRLRQRGDERLPPTRR